MILLENIKKSFGETRALDDVSFEVKKGEVVGLLGPNGAGKTTSMRIITGFLAADAGRVIVNGMNVSPDNIETKRLIGYLPESAPLYLDMEVFEFLEFSGKLRSMFGAELKSALDEVIGTCGLSGAVGKQIGKLSKGYRQRVGLASAMLTKPPILILDEPTSGLDPNQIVEIRGLIKEIGRERTVILSTHIMQEVEATCSKAIIISAGRLVGHGTLSELLKQSRLCSGYTISIRADKSAVESALALLTNFSVASWSSKNGNVQRIVLRSSDEIDRAEEIFNWAVAQKFILTELSPQEASLEEVFRELTQ